MDIVHLSGLLYTNNIESNKKNSEFENRISFFNLFQKSLLIFILFYFPKRNTILLQKAILTIIIQIYSNVSLYVFE